MQASVEVTSCTAVTGTQLYSELQDAHDWGTPHSLKPAAASANADGAAAAAVAADM
jgi:hypothetical protein